MREHSIGIFDSGVGGLTVAKAINALLPTEHLIYIGDTMHTPWGDKSNTTIKGYVNRLCSRLLKEQVKIIVVACHTASAIAETELQDFANQYQIPIFNVIDPVVPFIAKNHAHELIGIIGTRQTINSNKHHDKIKALDQNIQLLNLATPALVPLIEDGLHESHIMYDLLKHYFQPDFYKINALILACTHYPLLINQIIKVFNKQLTIIDPGILAAQQIHAFLINHNLQATKLKQNHKFYLTDNNPFFTRIAQFFFATNINIEQLPQKTCY